MDADSELNEAFEENDCEQFSHIIQDHPELLRHEDGSDRWMWMAAMDGKLRMMKCLVELGIDVNEPKDGPNASDPDDPYRQVEGSIVDAASNGQLEAVQWLLDEGAKINYVVQGQNRCLPLVDAATNGHLEVVKLLVERGADIHATWRGVNAITQAEDYGQFAVRDYLSSLGAKTLRETTPPDYAAAHEMILKSIVDKDGPLSNWKLDLPGDPLMTLHSIPPNKKMAELMIFTIGLSDRALPNENKVHACAELRCILPPTWLLTIESLHSRVWNWPIEWLKQIAVKLRAGNRWPDAPVVFMNGEPPVPLGPDTKLCGWLCLKSLMDSVHAPDYRWIDLHSLIPIYKEECQLIRKAGHEELIRRFEDRNIPVHIDPARPNVAIE